MAGQWACRPSYIDSCCWRWIWHWGVAIAAKMPLMAVHSRKGLYLLHCIFLGHTVIWYCCSWHLTSFHLQATQEKSPIYWRKPLNPFSSVIIEQVVWKEATRNIGIVMNYPPILAHTHPRYNAYAGTGDGEVTSFHCISQRWRKRQKMWFSSCSHFCLLIHCLSIEKKTHIKCSS